MNWRAFPALGLAGLMSLGSVIAQESEAEAAAESAEDAAAVYREAAGSVDTDLDAALEELAALRAQIAEQKPPLARAIQEQAGELRDKRRRAELARQQTDALLHDLQTLSNRVRLWRGGRRLHRQPAGGFSKGAPRAPRGGAIPAGQRRR